MSFLAAFPVPWRNWFDEQPVSTPHGRDGALAMEPPPSPSHSGASVAQIVGTGAIVFGPLVAVAVSVPLLWGRALHPRDIVLAVVIYVVTGHGVTVGFHRMFTHRSFRPNRALKLALGIAGSMAIQGSLISWVANHRRHHVYSDQPDDPHSPHRSASGRQSRLGGFAHAHMGWLFRPDDTPATHYAPDLLRDRDAVVLTRLFPVLAIASLALPFVVGFLLSGGWRGAVTAFVWAGVVRMALLHHVTWSINSVCHLIGRRPYSTSDHSGNVAALAIVSMGESWHNLHHALPSSARHGVGRWELDSSAGLIRLFERLGWATKVRWPSAERVESVRARPTSGLADAIAGYSGRQLGGTSHGAELGGTSMALWLIAAVIAVIGIVQLVQGEVLLAIVLFVVACLVGPGGYSIFRGRRTT